MTSNQPNQRVAFITGAGRGIGKALALAFAKDGFAVVAASTTMANNEAVAGEITREGGVALPIELDVSDEAGVVAAVRSTMDHFGRIDVLVNNAGLKPSSVPRDKRFLKDQTVGMWRRMYEVNVIGAFLCSRECAQVMIPAKRGAVINYSSGAALNPQAGDGLYSSSKAALNAMTVALSKELAEHGIAVNAINPGVTVTERTDPAALSPEQRARMVATATSVPLALFLANQETPEVTGQIISAAKWNAENGFAGIEKVAWPD